MEDNELLDIHEPDGLVEVDLLDSSCHTSFTGDDDLVTPVTLTNIFDHHSEDTEKVSDKSYDVIGLMKNDIVEEEWRSDERDLRHRKQILLQK